MKKIISIIVVILAISGIAGGLYFYLNKEDKESTLTILEKQWIEDNKNIIHDFSIVSKIPVFTLDGEGVFYEFISELEEKTSLDFNEMAYSYNKEIPSEYSFSIKNNLENNDILIYEDNYALLSKNEKNYLNLNDINDKQIGVLKTDLNDIGLYFNDTISFTSYENIDELFNEIKKDDTDLDFIALPKMMYLNNILENELNINYNISEMKLNYVITLGENETLNNIIKKYYNKWNNEFFEESFNKNFSKNYYNLASISNDSEIKFQSKQYVYGFVNNEPYDKLVNNKLIGINSEIIKKFAKLSNIEVIYKEYDNYDELISAFNNGKIDLFMNNTGTNKFDIKNIKSLEVLNEKKVILTDYRNNIVINSINSLLNSTVLSISNSKISNYLSEKNIKTKNYKTMSELMKKINKNSIIVLDYKTYQMYSNDILKNYIVKYEFNLNDGNSFVLKKDENEVLNKYFNFYVSFTNQKQVIDNFKYDEFKIEKDNRILKNIIYILLSILSLLVITIIIKILKGSKKKVQGITKENKLKYIDMLTSLKNRTYLNDHIEIWDDSGIYPQSIMIVDLNNIAYINDNYGHEEGDNVITEAANILIKNQLEQTEIVRTSGNEFLIYLVGYEEKQIIIYKRKLIKEFKELSHGFGAAVGYSMILDGLKTIDDAINEATLDMRANKEETE